MENIAAWLQTVVATLILAGFLEMLLPNNDLKGVTRLVMGLLIILILLQPLVKIFRLGPELTGLFPEIRAENGGKSSVQILHQGLALQEGWRNLWSATPGGLINGSESDTERMRKMVELMDEIEIRKLVVTPATGNRLMKVRLEIVPAQNYTKTAQFKRTVETKIKNAFQLFYNLNDGQIEVRWYE